jgi:hypothetical protein
VEAYHDQFIFSQGQNKTDIIVKCRDDVYDAAGNYLMTDAAFFDYPLHKVRCMREHDARWMPYAHTMDEGDARCEPELSRSSCSSPRASTAAPPWCPSATRPSCARASRRSLRGGCAEPTGPTLPSAPPHTPVRASAGSESHATSPFFWRKKGKWAFSAEKADREYGWIVEHTALELEVLRTRHTPKPHQRVPWSVHFFGAKTKMERSR